MIKILYFILGPLTLLNCKSVGTHQSNAVKPIYGKWRLITNAPTLNYPGITFNKDKTAIFSSFGDTVYYFTYKLKGGDLILVDSEKKVSHNAILKINGDSLIF